MKYRDLLERLQNMSKDQLEHDVEFYDIINDVFCDAMEIYTVEEEFLLDRVAREGLMFQNNQTVISF
jgi:hypothetical protein